MRRTIAAALVLFGASLTACSSQPSAAPSSLGPSCSAYFGPSGCCVNAARGVAGAVAACQSGATSAAADPSQAEAACAQGVMSAQAVGLCRGAGADGGQGGSADGGGASADAGASSDPLCARFIACSYQVAPSQAAGAAASYGPTGACWTTESASVCHDGCASGLAGLHDANPDAKACDPCASSADCSGDTPACDTSRGICVACNADSDCSGGRPACDLESHKCVACTSNATCAAPTSICDLPSRSCVACESDTDCTAPQICEPSSHTCEPCDQAGSCGGACGVTCDDLLQSTFPSVGSFDNETCTGGTKCSADLGFPEGLDQSCTTLCMPWTCTAPMAFYGTHAAIDHVVSDFPCDMVPPAVDRGAPFLSMQCTCSQ